MPKSKKGSLEERISPRELFHCAPRTDRALTYRTLAEFRDEGRSNGPYPRPSKIQQYFQTFLKTYEQELMLNQVDEPKKGFQRLALFTRAIEQMERGLKPGKNERTAFNFFRNQCLKFHEEEKFWSDERAWHRNWGSDPGPDEKSRGEVEIEDEGDDVDGWPAPLSPTSTSCDTQPSFGSHDPQPGTFGAEHRFATSSNSTPITIRGSFSNSQQTQSSQTSHPKSPHPSPTLSPTPSLTHRISPPKLPSPPTLQSKSQSRTPLPIVNPHPLSSILNEHQLRLFDQATSSSALHLPSFRELIESLDHSQREWVNGLSGFDVKGNAKVKEFLMRLDEAKLAWASEDVTERERIAEENEYRRNYGKSAGRDHVEVEEVYFSEYLDGRSLTGSEREEDYTRDQIDVIATRRHSPPTSAPAQLPSPSPTPVQDPDPSFGISAEPTPSNARSHPESTVETAAHPPPSSATSSEGNPRAELRSAIDTLVHIIQRERMDVEEVCKVVKHRAGHIDRDRKATT